MASGWPPRPRFSCHGATGRDRRHRRDDDSEAGDEPWAWAMRFSLDVTDPDSFAGFLDYRRKLLLGPIDVLVNNAGILPVGRLIDEPDALTQRALAVNVDGVIVGTSSPLGACPPGAAATSSTSPRRIPNTLGRSSNLLRYQTRRPRVHQLQRAEHRRSGVRYSAVLPTMTNTEMTAGLAPARGLRNAEAAESPTRSWR